MLGSARICGALLVVVMVLVGGGAWGGGAPAGAQSPATAEYVRDLEALLAELDRGYPFFHTKGIAKEWKATRKRLSRRVRGCKSDQQFFELVYEALRCLRDGHVQVRDVRPKLKAPPSDSYCGLSLLPATGRRVVVMTSTSNLTRLFPPGTIIEKIDGKNARKVIEALGQASWRRGGFFSSPQRASFFEYRLALTGKRGDRHTIHYRQGKSVKKTVLTLNQEVKGWPHNYNPPEGMKQGGRSVWFAPLEGGFGYVYLRRMDESVEKGIRAALEALPDARGWVVDLRGNTGGGYDSSLKELIARFQGPVAGIIDAGAVSAAETFARDLVNVNKARLFGAVSAGSSSQKKTWTFPSGIATVRYSVRSRYGVNQKPIEFNGVQPDEALEADPADLAQGKNTEILRALTYLRENLQ